MRATDNISQYRCPDEGQWMAFFDGEGKPAQREALGAHLRSCANCQTVFDEIGSLVVFADHALDLMHPATTTPGKSRRLSKVGAPMAAAAIVLGLGMGFHAAGQKAMAAIASLFQVKSIGTVGVTPQQLASLTRTVTEGGKVTLAHYGSIKVAGPLQQTEVPLSQLPQYGMSNLWPSSLGAVGTASVQTGLNVTLKLNVPNINQLITSQGGRYLFPMSLNQVPFTLSVPAAAIIQNGGWTLEEVPRPTVAVPGSVPVQKVAKALENLPFLPPQLQTAVAQMANWKNTLIVPLPGHPETVSVAGTQGIMDSNANGTTMGEAWVQSQGLVVAVMEHQSKPINPSIFKAEVSRFFK
ncbi:MAG: hypothetical protein C7B45_09925 [Sulfobacillus acidophilus]|uniref:Zinc-finger domain-containing protein n=1 Tax=Sulfobacillus acidophilus TaxID=53633 RepID=A0A2T2WHC1_9FIRM|nr:MAG: hypothetical protein C7B45_09925 [Sulfobacillus acidophilus]